MRITTVDPGVGLGVALAIDGVITYTEYHEPRNILQAFSLAKDYLVMLHPDMVVVECQYIGNAFQVGKVIGIVEKRCAWELAAYTLGIEFSRMYPSTWQKLISGGHRHTRKELAKLRTAWVKANLTPEKYPALYKKGPLKDDQESALAMLGYVLTLDEIPIIEKEFSE